MEEIVYNEAINKGQTECIICKETFIEDEENIHITECGHYFHWDCIKEWRKKKNLCPLCLRELKTFWPKEVEKLNKKMKNSGLVKVGIEEMFKLK
uniref:RING-type domain-containing protein n=1 Tax=Meloidogyne incognita TaxID=6306 RepID=A0A914NBT8_MELIC